MGWPALVSDSASSRDSRITEFDDNGQLRLVPQKDHGVVCVVDVAGRGQIEALDHAPKVGFGGFVYRARLHAPTMATNVLLVAGRPCQLCGETVKTLRRR